MLECLKSYLKKGWGSSLYSDMKEKIEKDFQIKKKKQSAKYLLGENGVVGSVHVIIWIWRVYHWKNIQKKC